MKITIDYGQTGLTIQVPDRNLSQILGLRPAPPTSDPDDAVRRALAAPIGAHPLADLARGRRSASILICDITRPVPNQLLLQPALSILENAGIAPKNIRILIATGLHRASTAAEINAMLGEYIAARYRIESHDARDAGAHRQIGVIGGAPILIDRRYLDADLKITTGLIEPHLMAGFSGGRKVICPGIAAVETIRHFHSVSILQSPLATAGQIGGNPVHDFSLQAARMAGCDFILNAALDDQRRITGIFVGDILQAWEKGVEHVRSIAAAPITTPADIVITSAAGYPLDGTFYQAVKGLVGAMPAVRTGGTIIMAASMQEGIGSSEFQSLLERYSTIQDLERDLEQPGFFCIDQWQAQELALASRRAHITVYSDSLPPEHLSRALVTPARSPEHAIAEALERYGPDASITVIPRGPYVLPYVLPVVEAPIY